MNSTVCNHTVLKCLQRLTAFHTECNTVATEAYRYYRYILTHGKRDDDDDDDDNQKQVYSSLNSKILTLS